MPVTPPICSVCGARHWLNAGHARSIERAAAQADGPNPLVRAALDGTLDAKAKALAMVEGETPEQRRKRLTRERVARHRLKS